MCRVVFWVALGTIFIFVANFFHTAIMTFTLHNLHNLHLSFYLLLLKLKYKRKQANLGKKNDEPAES